MFKILLFIIFEIVRINIYILLIKYLAININIFI